MDLTLDQLQVLDAIARTGTFAQAAAELHRVPSAVSYAVKNLEEALDLRLFDRTGRTAVLTPAGTRVLEAGREVLERASALEQLALELSGGWEPELRVVVDGALPMTPILRALRAFQSPEIPTRVRLDVEYREGVVDRFEADGCHLMGVIGFDPGEEIGHLHCTALPPLELALVSAADHPLQRDPLAPGAHSELVVRDSSPRFAASPKRSFLDSRHVLYLSDFHAKRLALLDGAGFGWIPLHFVAADLDAGSLALLPLEGREPTFRYAPQWVRRADAPPGKAVSLFTERLLANIHKS